jgi:hypothetical protein
MSVGHNSLVLGGARRDRWTWLLEWRADERKTAYLCILLLVSSGIVLCLVVVGQWDDYWSKTASGHLPSGDFFALWSYAQVASAHPATELYDFATLHAREVALGMDPKTQAWFPYPPIAILVLWPLSLLPYGPACIVWLVGTLALFVWAVWATCSRLPICVLGVILAPVTTATIIYGQSGYLAAALITAGIRLASNRPLLSGVLLGLLSYKPQLGVLLPIALVAAGYWRTLAVACTTVAMLAAVATIAFGWGVWAAWVAMLPVYQTVFAGDTLVPYLMPNVLGNMKMAGFPPLVAQATQAIVSIAVAVVVAHCFKSNAGRLAAAAVLVGTVLATPHALIYDMSMVLAGMVLLIQECIEQSPTFTLGTISVLVFALMSPLLMMLKKQPSIPISAISLLLLFGVVLMHLRDNRNICATQASRGRLPTVTH